jgi:2-keto-3-deoxy-L-fuconate dehydrogenase
MFQLTNKTALITGSGSGIGQAIAVLFAQQGAIVHLLDRDQKAVQTTVSQIVKAGGQAIAHVADVSQHQAVVDVVGTIDQLDILVNNAGIAHVGRLDNTPEADFDRIVAVNVKGVYNCLYAALPLLQQRGKGVILNLSSIAAQVGLPDRFAYSMSKGAVLSMTLSVARDYLAHGIRCNAISPARIHTPFVDGFLAKNFPQNQSEMFQKLAQSQPIGRMGTPQEVATLALFLCADEAAFITGCDYLLDGGFVNLNT